MSAGAKRQTGALKMDEEGGVSAGAKRQAGALKMDEKGAECL